MTAAHGPADGAQVVFERLDPTHPLVVAAMRRYFAELDARFGTDFAAQPFEHDGPFLVASEGGAPIAAVALRRIDERTAEVKRMWVDDTRRGAGLGRKALEAIEALAREQGATRIVLDTKRALVAAVGLYERSGYGRIERYNDNPHAELFFEKQLDDPAPESRHP